MNKYELYEKNKNLKGFDIMGHCFIADGNLFVYTLIGNGELIKDEGDMRQYAGDFRLIDVCEGNRFDDNGWNQLTIEEILNKIESDYRNLFDSVVYIGEPKFDMNLEGFDFVTVNVDYVGDDQR